MRSRLAAFFLGLIFLCAIPQPAAAGSAGRLLEVSVGKASFYSDKFHKKRTANGERYDKTKLTAAHRSLPIGTVVRVTNLRNGRNVLVRINDRGPTHKRLILDVSREAANCLNMIRSGIADVQVEVVSDSRGRSRGGEGFYVHLGRAASQAEGRDAFKTLVASQKRHMKKTDGKTGDKGKTSVSAASRKTLSRASFITLDGRVGKKESFLGIGPFSSFKDAESALRGLTALAPEAKLVCLPLEDTRSASLVSTLASAR